MFSHVPTLTYTVSGGKNFKKKKKVLWDFTADSTKNTILKGRCRLCSVVMKTRKSSKYYKIVGTCLARVTGQQCVIF